MYIGPPSSKETDKQIPPKNVETVSEVQGVAQQQGVYTIL